MKNKKYLIYILTLCISLTNFTGCAKEESKPKTATTGSSSQPEPAPDTDRNALSSLQWKDGSTARTRAIQVLKSAYRETQSLRLEARREIAQSICLQQLVESASLPEYAVDEELKKIDLCIETARKIDDLIRKAENPLPRLRALKNEIGNFIPTKNHAPKRLMVAQSHLEILSIISELEQLTSNTNAIESKLGIQSLEKNLQDNLSRVFAGLIEIAHAPETQASFKELQLARFWRKANWEGDDGIANPWTSPKKWNLQVHNQTLPLLADSADTLSKELLKKTNSDELIENLSRRPLVHSAAIEFAEKSPNEINLLLGVDKDIDPRALHDNWRREAARIAQAARIAISIIAFFDPARAQSMERALNAAVDAHSAIVAFGRAEIASAVFLARIASIGSRISSSQSQTEMRGLSVSFNAALSSFATRLSNLESEVSAIRSIIAEETLVNATRAREIQNELNQISARLARNAQMFSSALQASLRQPFDIQSEKCLGQNSALARLGHFPNNEIARECFDLAQLRASRLAREPAMTHLTTAEDTDFSPLATDPDLLWPWLSRELALAPIAVPNSREWSKGVEDMLLTLLASGLMRESGHLLEPFLRDVESIQELEDAASRPELLEKTWSEAISALKLAQETLHPIWQEFSQNKMFGADPGLFPETIQAMNPQDDLLELGIRAGIASAPERSGVYVVTSDGRTPHSWNPNFPEPIFLRYDWFWDAVVNGEHLGPARAANFLWECDANISACPATEIITPNCDRAAYNRVRGYCTDQAVQRRHLLRRISFDSSVIDKKIAEALKPKLAEALATFPQFASSHRNTRSAKVAVQNAKRALDRFFALLRLSYPSLIEQSQEIQSLWIGEMSIAGEKPFWLALEHPNSMQIFMRSDPNSLKRSIDGALKDAIAKPSFSSAAKKLWALFRDDP